jgi:hypothetical protein
MLNLILVWFLGSTYFPKKFFKLRCVNGLLFLSSVSFDASLRDFGLREYLLCGPSDV